MMNQLTTIPESLRFKNVAGKEKVDIYHSKKYILVYFRIVPIYSLKQATCGHVCNTSVSK